MTPPGTAGAATLGSMNTESHRRELRSPEAAAVPAGKPTLDGIEDKWMLRWAKERVVQV